MWIRQPDPGEKPRFAACLRACSRITLLGAYEAHTILLIGPCDSPSALLRSVYITTMVMLRPFLLLSPFLRRHRFFPFLFSQPRWRWQHPFLFFPLFLLRFANSSFVSVGVAFPSTSIITPSPSPSGAIAISIQPPTRRPNPKTKVRTDSVDGDHP